MSRIRYFIFSSNILFLSCLGPVHKDSFHASISRKLNQNIGVVESAKPRKFRPRLPKPSAKLLAAVASPVAVISRKRSKHVEPQLPLPCKLELPETDPKESRLVKSKKMKDDILNEYQQDHGADYSKPITTTS